MLYGDVPAALNGDASIACFMGRACAPLEGTLLLRIERGYAPAVLNGYVPAALNGDASRACFMGSACAPEDGG